MLSARHHAVRLLLLPTLIAAFSLCAAAGDGGKIPITTKSDDARRVFLTGRKLFENLKRQESVAYFRKAIALDPAFAMAAMYNALSEGTPRAFFDNVEKAAKLADKASEGERTMILGWQAGAAGEIAKQREYWTKAVTMFPDDERALTQLGTHYFGQQDYVRAAEHFTKAATINPEFPPAYNLLGYAKRFLGDLAGAENAFKKYTTLIPDDPNPYDSYAEFLMKAGRLAEAEDMYGKALQVDPGFFASRIGVATCLMYQDKPGEARRELNAMVDKARDDAERRQASFVATLTYLEEGNTVAALKEMQRQYAVAEKAGDAAALSGDLVAIGTIHLEAGDYEAAQESYRKSLAVVEKSSLSDNVKAAFALGNHYNMGVLAAAQGDFVKALDHAAELARGAARSKNANQARLAHELSGRIALLQKDYATATSELSQASQQNPYNLYRQGLVCAAQGNQEKARAFFTSAAEFHGLAQLNYALVRNKARVQLGLASTPTGKAAGTGE